MQCIDIDIDIVRNRLVLFGPPVPDFLPWVPRQRIVIDTNAVLGYSVTQVNDTSPHNGPARRSVYVTIDTLSRQHQIGVLVAEQRVDDHEWEPRNTPLVAKLMRALSNAIAERSTP